ncbi:MAG: DUF1232 domain-containing protein [Acidobacteriota bacterium]
MTPGALESTEHRGFYDRLRRRMRRSLLEERGLAPGTVDALLLAPDLFVLLVRLSLDARVPAADRALIGSALLYFVAPFDLVPEALLGAGGFIDDVVLAATLLTHALGPDLEQVAAEHWSGREALRKTLARLMASTTSLLGPGRSRLLQDWLQREREAPQAAPSDSEISSA